jgi:hypothetical protein
MSLKEAFVLWHRAAGYSYEYICNKLKIKRSYAVAIYYSAVVKSRKEGVSYLREPKENVQATAASSPYGISEFIVNEPVRRNKFEELKKLAAEAAEELSKIQKK